MDFYGRRSMSPNGADGPRESRESGRPGFADAYRRRSPGPPDLRRANRQRSRSPPSIDRYQPRDLRGERHASRRDDGRTRRSPPPSVNIDRYVPGHDTRHDSRQDSGPSLINALRNPISLDHQVNFTWFAAWWRKEQDIKEERERQKNGGRRQSDRAKSGWDSREEQDNERAQLQAAFNTYKEKSQAKQASDFVRQHKSEEWFKERYNPTMRDPLRQRQAEFRKVIHMQWQTDMDNGLFDDFSLEGIYKSESNGAGGIVEKEEGEATAAAEVLGVGDLVPGKGGDLIDEAVLQPALLIKTIAPHVSREKMEAFCKEHLGDGDGGFRWLSLSDPNPLKKLHRIGWIMLNPAAGDIAVTGNERGDGREEEGDTELREGELPENGSIPQGMADRALSEINGKSIMDEERGNFQCHVGVHAPPVMTRKKALWDLFAAPERIDRDLQLAIRLVTKLELELGDEVNGINKIEERIEEIRSKGALLPLPTISNKPSKANLGADMEEDEEGAVDDGENGAYDDEVDDEEFLAKKKKLDLLVEYLRRVFSFCFFCVFESDSVHELTRKCPGGHLRRPRSSLTSSAIVVAKASSNGEPFPLKRSDSSVDQEIEEASPVAEKRFDRNNKSHVQLQRAFNWVKTFEDKLFQILEPDSVDLKKLGGRPIEEALDEDLKKWVQQEDEAKFRCKVPGCTKLFKGDTFWRKHVEKRHADWLDTIRQDLAMQNYYVLDPAHVTPVRPDAAAGFMNGVQQGAARFGLAPIPFGLSQSAQSGLPHPNFPAQFGQYPVNMPPNWPNGAPYNGDGNGHFGPIRRGGGRFAGRAPAPYDRQPKDSRNARWTNNSGRMSPPLRRPSNGVPARFADAAGAAAVGPREAVVGRSLKSYEDLDAVAAGGNGELDY